MLVSRSTGSRTRSAATRSRRAGCPSAEAALDYGATQLGLLPRDGRAGSTSSSTRSSESKADFERYWYSEEIAEARTELAGRYQVPLLPDVLRDRRPGALAARTGAEVLAAGDSLRRHESGRPRLAARWRRLSRRCCCAAPAQADLDLARGAAASSRDAADGRHGERPPTACRSSSATTACPRQGGTTPNPGGVEGGRRCPPPTRASRASPARTPRQPPRCRATRRATSRSTSTCRCPTRALTPPAGGYPLVVMHARLLRAASKTSWEADDDRRPAAENWHYNNAWFASRGYVVLNYTARGFVNGHEPGLDRRRPSSTPRLRDQRLPAPGRPAGRRQLRRWPGRP